MYDVKQFKFNNGQEILCEIVEWPEEGFDDLIVRNAMEITKHNTPTEIYYSFRPWLHYNESSDELVIINYKHIVATANPNKHLYSQYLFAVQESQAQAEYRDKSATKDFATKMKQMAEEIISLTKETFSDSDKRPNNIIQFPEREF